MDIVGNLVSFPAASLSIGSDVLLLLHLPLALDLISLTGINDGFELSITSLLDDAFFYHLADDVSDLRQLLVVSDLFLQLCLEVVPSKQFGLNIQLLLLLLCFLLFNLCL